MLCDQCSVARALVVVALPNGGTLTFCKHHADEHFEALTNMGALIIPTGN